MKSSSWKKSGWRSLLHRGYPKCVVRFGNDGAKLKLLVDEAEFNQSETAAGRVPEQTLKVMAREAEAVWNELQDDESATGRSDRRL